MPDDAPVPATRQEILLATMMRAFAAQALRLKRAERSAAHWESQAVLRASTIANELAIRLRDAEIAEARMRERVRRALEMDHSDVFAVKTDLLEITEPRPD